jgi:Peptidase family C25
VNGHYAIDYSNTTDTRGFTKTSDKVLNAMKAKGFEVDRLWTTDDSKVKPQYYYDGTPIPNSLRRPSFGWNADTSDFLNAYNGGRFLIFHRDHGWQDGWANPQLDSGNVGSLSNGSKLPVVFGVNCESARFDDPAHPSFVELQLEKASGGAVAGFGDTRVSPTWPNNDMALGFFDALFPNTVPGFGSSTPSRRLGDILLSGKAYMASVWNGDDEYVEHYLYNLLGDPSMQMWAKTPVRWDVSKVSATTVRDPSPAPGRPFYHVVVTLPKGPGDPPPHGTIVTLFNSQGYAFGRALVGADGTATITPDDPGEPPRALHVGFEQVGALPAVQSVH